MSYRFEICRDRGGHYRARFCAPHGHVVLVSEPFDENHVIHGVIDSLRLHAATAEVVDLTAVDAPRRRDLEARDVGERRSFV